MTHPLSCWDIIMDGQMRRDRFASDLANLRALQRKSQWQLDDTSGIENALIWENKTILVTNAAQEIVFATINMQSMNGYRPSEVLGKRPSLFQGPDTQAGSKRLIREAIQNRVPFTCSILNYRKNGSKYNCLIDGFPMLNKKGELTHYLALEEELFV